MGVHGLWTIVGPVGRPTKVETLARKRLAVDASIWIYQFLKAVRDKEGNQLRSSHIVGFFQRICKLLYFGIRPVFVFDGGAPDLKRRTIAARKRRREGRREDAVRTAGRILAHQMRERAEEEEKKRKRREAGGYYSDEEELPANLVYVDELFQTPKERERKRFRKQDQYHLPEMDSTLDMMGGEDDMRIMSHEELQEYAEKYRSGEKVNYIDFSKMDFDSQFFRSLPEADRYNILKAARLRSRLRMGLSAEQLSVMFPNRMEFSKFQISRVKERNDLTQRLFNINSMNDDPLKPKRVARDRHREYILVKNDGVDGGWSLGMVGPQLGESRDKPIELDKELVPQEEDSVEEEEFEDIPIQGLNRLPTEPSFMELVKMDVENTERELMRQALYASRREVANRTAESSSIDYGYDNGDDDMSSLFGSPSPPSPRPRREEEEDIAKAIALSLEHAPPLYGLDKGKGKAIEVNQLETNQFEPDSDDDEDLQTTQRANLQGQNAAGKLGESSRQPGGFLPDDQFFTEESTGEKEKAKTHEPETVPPWFSASVAGIGIREHMEKERKRHQAEEPSHTHDWPSMEEEFNLAFQQRERTRAKRMPIEKKSSETIIIDDSEDEVMEDAQPSAPQKVSPKAVAQPSPPPAARPPSPPHEAQRRTLPTPKPVAPSPMEPQIDSQPVSTQKGQKEPTKSLAAAPSLVEDKYNGKKIESAKAVQDVRAGIEPGDLRLIDGPSSFETSRSLFLESENQAPSTGHRASDDVEVVTEKIKENTTTATDVDENDEPLEWDESGDEGPSLTEVRVRYKDPTGGLPLTAPTPLPPQTPTPVDIPDDFELENPDFDLIEPEGSDTEDELVSAIAEEQIEIVRLAGRAAANQPMTELELKNLRAQQKRDLRDSDEVTTQMIDECKALLEHFGLPYITAPQEAEAQCATLLADGLVDGIITDDSDIFLFGGDRVYKNLFNPSKQVEVYLFRDLESELALSRERLIDLALLLGSDYTEGIRGIGPVSAMEILSEFTDLSEFHQWWVNLTDPTKFGKLTFATKLQKTLSKALIKATAVPPPPPFPPPAVLNAYQSPNVDAGLPPFKWGKPDLENLKKFLMDYVGWTSDRTDEVLIPVIREMDKAEKQVNLTRYFEGGTGGAFAPRVHNAGKSKRLQKAVGGLKKKVGESPQKAGSSNTPIVLDGPEEEPVSLRRAAGAGDTPSRDGPISLRAAAEAMEEESEEDGSPVKKRRRKTGKMLGKTSLTASLASSARGGRRGRGRGKM